MRRTLVKDLCSLERHDLAVLHDPRVKAQDDDVESIPVTQPGEFWTNLANGAEKAEAVWPIAPESGGQLARMIDLARGTGKQVIGSSPRAITLSGSKQATASCLAAAGLTVVPTRSLDKPRPASRCGWVVKPDDGAGAEDTWFLDDEQALEDWIAARNDRRGMVVQPFIEGTPASLSLLCQDGRAWLLSCNRQFVAHDDGRFGYCGGVVGALQHRQDAFAAIAQRIAGAIPGLWGYVGVDLIDSEAGPVVLEVNPRLTTSYVALGRALGLNPAGLILELTSRKLDDMARPLNVVPTTVAAGTNA